VTYDFSITPERHQNIAMIISMYQTLQLNRFAPVFICCFHNHNNCNVYVIYDLVEIFDSLESFRHKKKHLFSTKIMPDGLRKYSTNHLLNRFRKVQL